MSNDNDDDDGRKYEVGYGKPPRHTRFAPGRSGNPRGRRKGSRGLKTDLHRKLSAQHTIQISGRPIKGGRQQLVIKTLATPAASGDLKAQGPDSADPPGVRRRRSRR